MCLAVPGRVVAIESHPSGITTATVDAGGVERTLCIDYVPDVRVGDYVVASLGFAVRQLTEEEAMETYEALGQLFDLSALDLPGAGDPEPGP
jgi:hydrogenase expression/formation protein HypC